MTATFGILEPRDFSPSAMARLKNMGRVEVYEGNNLAAFLAEKEVLFVRLGHLVDQTFLEMAPRLRVLVSPTTALTHIDLDAAARRALSILSLRGERDFLRSITATPEHCLGLIISLLRRYPRAYLSPLQAHWDRDRVRGHDLRGQNVGIIGFGRIGQWLARVLAAMEARVLFDDSDACVGSVHGACRAQSKQDLVAKCSIIVVAASYTNGQAPIVDATLLDAMAGKYLVNIARGELLDEDYLLELVAKNHFAGVALDVIQGETTDRRNLARMLQLAERHDLIVTPHVGGATVESSHRTEEFMVERLQQFLSQQS